MTISLKSTILRLLLLMTLIPALSAGAQNGDQTILRDGTAVKLKTLQGISSDDVCAGDLVQFQTLDEVRADNQVVIPQGSPAVGRVAAVERSPLMARGARLQIELNSVSLVNGQQAPLRSINQVQGAGQKKIMVGGMIMLGAAAPLALLMHGKSASIPQGTEMTAYVNGNVPVDLHSSGTAAPQPASETPSLSAAHRVTIDVVTKPPGASVAIDGAAMGSSPTCVHVTPGTHVLEISESGYKPQQLRIKADKSPKQIKAELRKAK